MWIDSHWSIHRTYVVRIRDGRRVSDLPYDEEDEADEQIIDGRK